MKINSRKILARNLDALMREHQLNQVELSKRSQKYGTGINQKTISNYLDQSDDSVANPCLNKIEILAQCFKIEPSRLLSPNLEEQKAQISVNEELLVKSMSDAVALLFEAGIFSAENAQYILGFSDDIAKATAIIYNGKAQDPNKIVFDFMAYLNARKASNAL